MATEMPSGGKPGDVLFLRSPGLRSRINRTAQTLATLKKARFSHVMLCVSPGVLIDATPKHGVALHNTAREVIAERLTDQMCREGDIVVLRPPAGSWNVKPGRPLVTVLAHIGKKYNWKFLRSQASDADPQSEEAPSAFCSELVVILLGHWKVLPKGALRRASATLPVHLAQLPWTDVTAQWQDQLQEIRQWSESADPNTCKKAGLALYAGNQQIQLMQALHTVEFNLRPFRR